MNDEVRADAAKGLQALVDAVGRGELTAESLEELEMLCRIEGAVATLSPQTSFVSRSKATDLFRIEKQGRDKKQPSTAG